MTTLPKTDTNCTALSLMPAIIGNTFAASLRTDICPQRKESSSTSHARNPFNLSFFEYAAIAVTTATARRDGERCFQPAECFFLERMTVETLQQQSLHKGYTP